MPFSNNKPPVPASEIAKHTTRSTGVWIIVHDQVYDITEWLDEHPGGSKILLKYAGKDATEEFEPIHPRGVIEDNLEETKWIGPVDKSGGGAQVVHVSTDKSSSPNTYQTKQNHSQNPNSAPAPASTHNSHPQPPQNIPASASSTTPSNPPAKTTEKETLEQLKSRLPPLDEVLSLHDFENLSREVMSRKGWAYYSSGSDDEITMRENYLAYQRIWFRPRVLRDVSNVDFSTTLLGTKTSMPIYITGTALGKLGHPEGEVLLTRAAGKHNVIQQIPTLASCSFDELMDAAIPNQDQWLQLYVNADRNKTKKIVQHAEERGVKALFITVDAPQLGRREKDMRMKFDDPGSKVQEKDVVTRSEGAARAISSFIDASLSWKDLAWFKTITKLPIILKGVQCWEDAVEAKKAGMAGIVLSNHGGRQLDTARSGIEILAEVVEKFKEKGMWPCPEFEIFIDGGVRRASDVLKAVALGAKAVGIGRPFLYAMSTYGQDGVDRALQILKDEFEMNLRLIGAPTLAHIDESMVDARSVYLHTTDLGSSAFTKNYEPLTGASLRANL